MDKRLVVLINPGHDDEVNQKIARSYGARSRRVPREDPPISIINLGGYIRDHGFDVVILDTHVVRDYKERLKDLVREKPLVIGFSVILGKFLKNAMSLTRLVKELDGDVPVVWGGKLVYLGKDLILDQMDVDFLVLGDGEIPFLRLLNCLREGKDYRSIAGLGFKDNGRTVLNLDLEPVANLDSLYISQDCGWDLVKDYVNFRQIPYFINLYTSRGCKYNRSFCYLQDIKRLSNKIRFRRRSAENIIKEIDYLHNKFGINVVTFGDDDFLTDLQGILPVFEYLRRNRIYIEHVWTNVNNLKPEAIDLLAGICQTVCYSIETISPRLQKILRKSIQSEKIMEVNRQLRRVGINTVHNILFGVPTETDVETRANIEILMELKKINPHVRANTYILTPIPETPIFEFAKKLTGADIPYDLEDLANFHFRYLGRVASKFRPYFNPEDNQFYETVSELTNALFTELNTDLTEEQRVRIQASDRLQYIFAGVENVDKPVDRTRKYILDKIIDAMDAGQPLPAIEPF